MLRCICGEKVAVTASDLPNKVLVGREDREEARPQFAASLLEYFEMVGWVVHQVCVESGVSPFVPLPDCSSTIKILMSDGLTPLIRLA